MNILSWAFIFVFGSCALATDVLAEKPVLEKARTLGAGKFNGWKYGSSADKKQIDCVQFLVAVVEEVNGATLPKDQSAAILINPPPKDLAKAVQSLEPETKGVVHALVDLAKTANTVAPDDAKAGDMVQYWIKDSGGVWIGHAAVVSKVWKDSSGGARVALYGAHRSTDGVGETDFNKVGLALKSPDRIVYICRMK